MLGRTLAVLLLLLCGYLAWGNFDQAITIDHIKSSFEGSKRDRKLLLTLANSMLLSLPEAEAREHVSRIDWEGTFQLVKCDSGGKIWIESLADIDLSSPGCASSPNGATK